MGKKLMLKTFNLMIFTFCLYFSVLSQTVEEKEVKIKRQIGSRYFSCFVDGNKIYDAEGLKKLATQKDCSIANVLKVDFAKEDLLGYRVGGDCFITAEAKVFRNDAKKNYEVRIFNYWGGCRAGGSFVGWLVIDKIPKDYNLEFKEILVEERNKKGLILSGLSQETKPLEVLQSREIDLKGCIQTIFKKDFFINDEATYLKTIRNDASRNFCLKEIEKIDFAKNNLLGVEINSGYCQRPQGLKFNVLKDEKTKEIIFEIVYDDPKGSVCRALSQYDLWVLIPKIPIDFTVKFDVSAKDK